MNDPGEEAESSWFEIAGRVGELLPPTCLDVTAVNFLESQSAEHPWLLACSGGADSVLLTLLLFAHFPERRESLTLAHFNHALRGKDSGTDEAFVHQLAAGLRLNFVTAIGSGEIRDEASLHEARLDFLRQTASDCNAKVILQGHQRDDVAETLLWRLARGAGLAGLAAPRPVRHAGEVTFVRPLLSVSREDVRRLLKEAEGSWREDASNASREYFRNRLRAGTMCAWREDADRDVISGAARSRQLLEEADDALEDWAKEVLAKNRIGEEVNVVALTQVPKAVRRKVVARWLNELVPGCFPDAKNLDQLLATFDSRSSFKVSLTTNVWVKTDGEKLRISGEHAETPTPPWQTVALPAGGRLFLPEGGSLARQSETPSPECLSAVIAGKSNPNQEAFLSAEAIPEGKLTVRKRCPGDRFHPLGAPGQRKLKKIFIDHKVPLWLRDALPVVVSSEGTILWIPGLPPAEQAKVKATSEQVIRLTYVAS